MSRAIVPPIQKYKIIRDPIHGYIPITKEEYQILQSPVINRLHDLRQLSMAYLVFPGATGSRFLHSIGAMHVASKLAYQLLQSVEKNLLPNLFKSASKNKLLEVVESVRLAALLHDVGHGPFSHATEHLMSATLESKHKGDLKEAKTRFNVTKTSDLPVHEFYSVKIIEKYIPQCSPDVSVTNIAALLTKDESPRQDLCTMEGLSILRKIVSSQLDADRMDYLLRDAYFTGVTYGSVDTERVIMSMCIRQDKRKNFEVAVHERGLAAVEDMLDARFKMYKWLVSHHMVVALDELLKQAIIDCVASANLQLGDFYWDNLASKGISDSYVFARLQGSKTKNYPYAGLFDRRYLPVSLLKRPEDHKAFQADVALTSGKSFPPLIFKAKLEKIVSDLEQNPIVKITAHEVHLLATSVSRSAYSPIKSTDRVWICSDRDALLSDLTEKSVYFEAINREWSDFPSYYIAYVIAGKPKSEAAEVKTDVRNRVVEMLV